MLYTHNFNNKMPIKSESVNSNFNTDDFPTNLEDIDWGLIEMEDAASPVLPSQLPPVTQELMVPVIEVTKVHLEDTQVPQCQSPTTTNSDKDDEESEDDDDNNNNRLTLPPRKSRQRSGGSTTSSSSSLDSESDREWRPEEEEGSSRKEARSRGQEGQCQETQTHASEESSRNKSEDHAVDSEPAAGPPPQPQRHHLALREGRRLRHPRHGALRPAVGRGQAQHQDDVREALPRHAVLLPQRRAGDGARAAADLQVRCEHGGLESSRLGRSQLRAETRVQQQRAGQMIISADTCTYSCPVCGYIYFVSCLIFFWIMQFISIT